MSDNRMTMADHQAKATREEHRRIDAFAKMLGEQKAEHDAEQAAQKADAARFRWLTEDHDRPTVRDACREILRRLPVMSYGAACADIDAAMVQDGGK